MIRSDKETEKIVENMLIEGKSYRKIMEMVQVSPNRIKAIRNKLTGESSQAPKYTQAYRLFSQGKSRYEVAEKLEIREKEAREYHLEYRRLDMTDSLSRLYRIHGAGFITQLESLAHAFEKNGIAPNQCNEYIKTVKGMEALKSEEKTFRESRSKLELENKDLIVRNNESKFEFAKNSASAVCIEEALEAEIKQIETLLYVERRIKKAITILRHKVASQRAAFLRGSLKLSETDMNKETHNLVEQFIQRIIGVFGLYIKTKNGFIGEDDLMYNQTELEQMLRKELNEPMEEQLRWMIELLTEDLYEQNGYGISS